jgi:oligopeptidase A
MSNPLLTIKALPVFSTIHPENIKPAIEQKLQENRDFIEHLLSGLKNPHWDNFVEPLEQINDELESIWSPISHLNAVKNSDELRRAYNNCLPMLTEYATELGQHEGLYQAFRKLAESDNYKKLNQPQKRIVDNALRDFHLSGIDLSSEKKQRFKAIKNRLAELSSKFSDNVLDATQSWYKQIEDAQELAGLPETALNTAKQAAKNKQLEGWVLTLDIPSYLPVMQYCENEKLREELYTAYNTRASELGPAAGKWDNSELMVEILSLRRELSQLLGFNNYAEQSLARKMAKDTDQVLTFLSDLAEKSLPVAQQDFAELSQFARNEYGKEQLQAWDVAFYSEKLRKNKYSVSQEELKPYFPADKVIDGMFAIVGKLYGIELRPGGDFDNYHPQVRLFDILQAGEVVARFYLDPYARDKKRGGAWMADCRSRRVASDHQLQIPVAFLVCNFTPPTDTQPSLLTHQEVTTLFHEFGHGLHHMLSKIDQSGVSGINGVEWDAVELPSQFMENWCWEKDAIPLISEHFETAEPLPDSLLDKLLAARNFQSGMQMVRQLEFSLFDFRLHMADRIANSAEIQALIDSIRAQIAVVPTPQFNRFQHSFSHIFSGGYAAGYYSYKWAEVLSADAFSLFEEKGIFDQDSGRKFLQEILQKGGSDDAMKLFVAYRGREPEVDALLRHSGIAS